MGQYRELDVTVLSAKDLKNVNLMGGAMNPYCVAWLYPHMKVSGAVNKGGGVSPVWNSVIKLVVEESLLEQGHAHVTVDIYNHGTFSNKLIGSAQVPLADINAQAKAGSSSASKSLSYQVRKKSGKHQGTINMAVRIGAVLSEAEATKHVAPPSMGVPAMGMGGQHAQQYGNQQYYPQQYPPQYGQQYQQPGARPRRGGMGGGAGLGLGAGLLGGMLLGSALDGGGGGCGGGGGGGCGGGCGG